MSVKVSVIIPVYNAEEYLNQCLETVLGQTFREIEIILIDDGSTDNSYQICREFSGRDNRIRLYQQKNRGPGPTRNHGIELATGEYLLFLDSDDFFELDMIQTLYRRAKVTDSDVVFCDFWEFDDVAKEDKVIPWSVNIDRIPKRQPFCLEDCPDTILQMYTCAVWSTLYKRSFIIENNIKFQSLHYAEDMFFNRSSLILAKRISFVNEKLLHYRVNTLTSLTAVIDKNLYDGFYACENLFSFLMKINLYYFLEKSFINFMINFSVYTLIETFKYPLRFWGEAYFVEKIIPKYQLNSFKKRYFYDTNSFNQMGIYVRSSGRSYLLRKCYDNQKNKIIPIVLVTGKDMSLKCGVTIQSIIEHASDDYFYDIYILCADMSEHMKYNLENMTTRNIHVAVVDVGKYIRAQAGSGNSKIISETYYYFFIPSIVL